MGYFGKINLKIKIFMIVLKTWIIILNWSHYRTEVTLIIV